MVSRPTCKVRRRLTDTDGEYNCDSYNGYARPRYRTRELVTSNTRVDMVMTYGCSGSLAGADDTIGRTRWMWH